MSGVASYAVLALLAVAGAGSADDGCATSHSWVSLRLVEIENVMSLAERDFERSYGELGLSGSAPLYGLGRDAAATPAAQAGKTATEARGGGEGIPGR